jgi:predicted RNA binding protein YcfA (HicA-like mRNA interferase family)
MPKKTAYYIKLLLKAGFTPTGGCKGSHRRFTWQGKVNATICGHDGDDAPVWLPKHVEDKISEARKQQQGE